ncbi:MAG: nucleotidyl transferase AbiEii/AbiGii toxin family protein, partial [Flexibacteraceae bacterium]
MIDKVCLTKEYINGLKSERYSSLDPALLEKTIRAMVLLEEMGSSGVPFIFIGGTALMLLTQEPKRLSIDLDIIIEDANFDAKEWLNSIVGNDFDRVEVNERIHPNLPAKHFKVFYTSEIQASSQRNSTHIIVDVLFQDNPYSSLIYSPITIPALKHTQTPKAVKTPDLQAILPDKLSAFAPNTIG